MKYKTYVALLLLAFLLSISMKTLAERPFQDKQDATYIFTGIIQEIFSREDEHNLYYIAAIRIDEVERGELLKKGEIFYASYFTMKPNPPPEYVGPGGHKITPLEAQRIKAYVNRYGGENQGVYPYWMYVLSLAPE